MELLHQFFVKLGARYVVVTDSSGLCMSLARLVATHLFPFQMKVLLIRKLGLPS